MCKQLLYIAWKNNKANPLKVLSDLSNKKVLLYNTRGYNQYPTINHNGNEYEKEYIYVCGSMYKITLLYTINKYNIANKLYFNKIN